MRGTIWWDFDGTLVSRPRMWAEAAMQMAARVFPGHDVNVNHFSRQFKRRFPWHREGFAHPELETPALWWSAVYDVFIDAFAHLGFGDVRAHVTDIRSDILNPCGYGVFEDAEPVLDELTRGGWRHVMVSNHVPELGHIVRQLGFAHFFHAIITSGEVGYEKPHPRIFGAARECSISGQPVWMIGDNLECDCLPVESLGGRAILVRTRSVDHMRCAGDLYAASDMIVRSVRDM